MQSRNNMLRHTLMLAVLVVLTALFGIACGDGSDAPADGDVDQGPPVGGHEACDGMTEPDCFEIHKGETVIYRHLSDYSTLEFDDDGTVRTVARLQEIVGLDMVDDPSAWRYQVYGTDGYTFGGFATWTNIENGYIEPGIRKVVFEPSQELPHSFRVKDAWKMVLSPAE